MEKGEGPVAQLCDHFAVMGTWHYWDWSTILFSWASDFAPICQKHFQVSFAKWRYVQLESLKLDFEIRKQYKKMV